MDIFEKVCDVLAEYSGHDASEFTAETSFEDLGIDSLATAELVMELEEELNVELELDEKISTIGELVAFVEKKVG
ncbi:MAG: phosphopantetheine-binding protein [Clostridiales bacterium]|nr:phosphopantetheine-binding protein [Clostridiales bacterium]